MDRMDKINAQMKREISQMMQTEFQDSRLSFVTILGVSVSRDLHYATVSYSVLGGEKDKVAAGESLEKLRGYIRKLIGQRIRMRYTPEIRFVYDDSIAYGARIEKAFQEIKEKFPFDASPGKDK